MNYEPWRLGPPSAMAAAKMGCGYYAFSLYIETGQDRERFLYEISRIDGKWRRPDHLLVEDVALEMLDVPSESWVYFLSQFQTLGAPSFFSTFIKLNREAETFWCRVAEITGIIQTDRFYRYEGRLRLVR